MRAIREALRAIGRAKLRSAFVSFTFALGFGSVLLVFGTVEGGRLAVEDTLHALGIDIIGCLNRIEFASGFIGIGERGEQLIDASTIEELRVEFGDDIEQAVPVRIELTTVDAGKRLSARTTALVATSSGFQNVLRSGIFAGRFLEPGDRFDPDAAEPSPAAIDEALARRIEPKAPESLVGRTIAVERGGQMIDVRVVGILRDPILLRKQLEVFDAARGSRDLKARRLEFLNVYVQYEPALEEPSGVLVQIVDPDRIDAYGERLRAFFEARDIVANFHVQKVWIEAVIATVDDFSYLAYFFCFVDLFIVGVICATIALLAIEMRYVEFATMRAEGARVSDVVAPVLAEGLLLAAAAAPLGFAIAFAAHELYVEPQLGWPAAYPFEILFWTPVGIAFVALVAYGLPARRVARLDPARIFSEAHS